MKKVYFAPNMEIVKVKTMTVLAASEGGVATGGSLGNSYKSDDQSYSSGLFDSDDNEEW